MADMNLAQQLAAHPRWTWKPGMACRNPETGKVWRKDDTATCFVGVLDGNSMWTGPTVVRADTRADIASAIAAGPDLSDWPTVGALIGMMGEAFVGLDLRREVPHMVIGEWICVMRTGSGMDAYQHVTHAATAGVAVADALVHLWGAA